MNTNTHETQTSGADRDHWTDDDGERARSALSPAERAIRFREAMEKRGETYLNRIRVPREVARALQVDAQQRRGPGGACSVSSVAAEILKRHYAIEHDDQSDEAD